MPRQTNTVINITNDEKVREGGGAIIKNAESVRKRVLPTFLIKVKYS